LPACKIDSDAGQQIFIFENWWSTFSSVRWEEMMVTCF
jgi:hypothetical protein